MRKRTRITRIDEELYLELDSIAKKNNITVAQASRELAKIGKQLRGKSIKEEIRF